MKAKRDSRRKKVGEPKRGRNANMLYFKAVYDTVRAANRCKCARRTHGVAKAHRALVC